MASKPIQSLEHCPTKRHWFESKNESTVRDEHLWSNDWQTSFNSPSFTFDVWSSIGASSMTRVWTCLIVTATHQWRYRNCLKPKNWLSWTFNPQILLALVRCRLNMIFCTRIKSNLGPFAHNSIGNITLGLNRVFPTYCNTGCHYLAGGLLFEFSDTSFIGILWDIWDLPIPSD